MRGISLAGLIVLATLSGPVVAQPPVAGSPLDGGAAPARSERGRSFTRDAPSLHYADASVPAEVIPTQFVRVQVKIIALHKSQVAEGVVPKDEAKSELLFPSMERLKQLEESGSATLITRAEVVTGSGLEASWQDGETMLVPVGRTQNGFTRSGREGVPVPSMAVNYQQERVGTMIRVTPRIHGETIVANLTLEQSVVPPFELKEPDATAAPQPLQRTHTVKSTVPLRPGAPLIVGGYQSISLKNGQPTETFHVVVMSAQILP